MTFLELFLSWPDKLTRIAQNFESRKTDTHSRTSDPSFKVPYAYHAFGCKTQKLTGKMSYTGEKLLCNHDWTIKDDQQWNNLVMVYRVGAIIYIVLSITATLGNILILLALQKDSRMHPPSKLLLRSLSITDLCVGVVSQPLLATLFFSASNGNPELCRVSKSAVRVATSAFSGVSLLTLTAIGVDRLLALLMRLRYRQIVTVKRVRVAILLFWLTSSVIGIIYLWDAGLYLIVSGVLVLLFVAISTYCYTRIFRIIRRKQRQAERNFGSQSSGLNIVPYKKTVYNALWIHLTLVTCYLPFALTAVVITIQGSNTLLLIVEGIASILVCLNSSLNPVLYCWKITEVRQAVKETVRRVFGSTEHNPIPGSSLGSDGSA